MAGNNIPFNRTNSDPDLADAIAAVKKDIMRSLNCHAIGTIQEFFPATQSATVSINYYKTFVQRKSPYGENSEYVPLPKEYPLLLDVPVVTLAGAGGGFTVPIQKGDTCVILFNDKEIDGWFESGQITALNSARMHSLSDGIALVGIRHLGNPIPGYDPERPTMYKGSTKVAVGTSKVEIANSSDKLGLLLKELIDEIKLITVTCASPGNPSGVPLNAVQLSAIATKIQGLLE